MQAPIFAVCSANNAVKALIGTSPVRLYPDEAPQTVTLPYAVYQTITGLPENYVNQRPDIDQYTVQVNCYGATLSAAQGVAQAIRDAIEDYAHVTSWRGDGKDPDTNHYRYSFDVTWFVNR